MITTANALTPITLADLRRETGALLIVARRNRQATLAAKTITLVPSERRSPELARRRDALMVAA